MKKKVKHSLGSYKVKNNDYSSCDVDEVAQAILNIFEQKFTTRIPFVVCCELRILAQAYFHYKQQSKRCKAKLKKG